MEIFLKKNEAAELTFPAVDSASPASFKTGVSPVDTAYYMDGGSWTTLAITDTATEIGSTGMYQLSMAQAEMNHDLIAIKFAVSGMADTMIIIRTKAVDMDDIVRATTPANTLDVNATGEAGIDWANVGGQGTSVDLSATAIDLCDDVTTAINLTTNNDKTGYSISGAITTLDGLENVAATDIVSTGAINTSSGAVSQVTTTVNLTTNNDKTGYAIDTNNDKTGYSIADATSDAVIADAVWNALLASYGIADSYGEWIEAFAGDATAANQATIIAYVDELETRLSAARAGYLDNLNGHVAQSGNSYPTINTNLNAAITTRSSHAALDIWAVGTRALTDKSNFNLAANQATVTIGTVTTLTGHVGQTADHTAGIADIPTVAEFNARTIPTNDYFDPALDTVANVTLVATTTAVTNDVGISQNGADKVWGTAARTLTAGTNLNDLSTAEVLGEVNTALDTAFTDATSLNTNGLKERIRALMWVLRNKMEVTDANGNTVIYKDDGVAEAVNVLAALTDDLTTTTRKRMT